MFIVHANFKFQVCIQVCIQVAFGMLNNVLFHEKTGVQHNMLIVW